MHILQAEHPTTPGVILKLFHTRPAAEREGIKLLRTIGDDVLAWLDEIGHETAEQRREAWEKLRDREDQPFIVFDKHVAGMVPSDAGMLGFTVDEFYVLITEAKVQDEEEAVRAAVTEAIEDGVLKGAETVKQAADRALAKSVDAMANIEPLPTGLMMIDQIIDMGGEAGQLARFAKVALSKVVAAGAELHASLGEAIERHIYNFDNGDEITPGCTFHAAMRSWASAMAGEVSTYAKPASELPWRMVVNDRVAYLSDAKDKGTGIAFPAPTEEQVQDMLAVLEAVNAQPSISPVPEIAVIMEGGSVSHVVGRNSAPVTVHIVDYDTDEMTHEDDAHPIPQDSGEYADAKLCTYDRAEIVTRPEFWEAVRAKL